MRKHIPIITPFHLMAFGWAAAAASAAAFLGGLPDGTDLASEDRADEGEAKLTPDDEVLLLHVME
jgi:hypothetical protein